MSPASRPRAALSDGGQFGQLHPVAAPSDGRLLHVPIASSSRYPGTSAPASPAQASMHSSVRGEHAWTHAISAAQSAFSAQRRFSSQHVRSSAASHALPQRGPERTSPHAGSGFALTGSVAVSDRSALLAQATRTSVRTATPTFEDEGDLLMRGFVPARQGIDRRISACSCSHGARSRGTAPANRARGADPTPPHARKESLPIARGGARHRRPTTDPCR